MLFQFSDNRELRWAVVALASVSLAALMAPRQARAADETTVRVLVTDATTGDPVFQAHLTLQFTVSRRLRPGKSYSLSAKTDMKGLYRFRDVPKGKVRLLVIAEHHQTFGQEYEITQDNQLIHVKLKRPQPQV